MPNENSNKPGSTPKPIPPKPVQPPIQKLTESLDHLKITRKGN
jgi:hypothetical protein